VPSGTRTLPPTITTLAPMGNTHAPRAPDGLGRAAARPSETQTDPPGAADGSERVVRGGAFSYPPEHARSASRSYASPSYRGAEVGVRLSRNAPTPTVAAPQTWGQLKTEGR